MSKQVIENTLNNKSPFINTQKSTMLFKSILKYILAIAICLFFVFPVYWLVLKAFTPPEYIMDYPPKFIPPTFTLENFKVAFTQYNIGSYILNTCIVVGGSIAGAVLSCSLVAYGFARIKFKGRNVLFFVLLSTMMIPWDVTIIPQFTLYTKIGWTNSFLPLVVPTFFACYQGAFFVFLMRQFIMGIPYSLDEAGEIDGCNKIQVFYRIIFPLMKPILATVIIYQFLYSWNDFIYPLIFLDDYNKFTLTLGIYLMKTPYETPWGPMMAAAAFACIIPVTVFFVTQEKLLGGLAASGIKS